MIKIIFRETQEECENSKHIELQKITQMLISMKLWDDFLFLRNYNSQIIL